MAIYDITKPDDRNNITGNESICSYSVDFTRHTESSPTTLHTSQFGWIVPSQTVDR